MKKAGDSFYLMRAAFLAEKGLGHTRPNPAVGAVLVKAGKIIGEGWHRRAGGDHAEVAALKDAAKKRNPVRGATLYVTLEPCSKSGRVGACTDAIAASGIRKVVYAIDDPNPVNRGRAKRVLARRGVVCERFQGDPQVLAACSRPIRGFEKHIRTGLPFVTVKIAMSLDGKICDDWGASDWISSETARAETNRLREKVDAIMVGAETIRKDDPSLLARIHPNKDLVRVVVSKSGRLPKAAQILTDGRNPTLVFDDAKNALRELGKRGFSHVLCEGGLTLARSLADLGLVDEWLTVLAPVVIGSRRIRNAMRGETDVSLTRLVGPDQFVQVDFSSCRKD